LPWTQANLAPTGHAIEARLYAEDPANDFLPVTGEILAWRPAAGESVRVDGGIRAGDSVTVHYDPLLAKIIAHGPTRADALRRLDDALRRTVLLGLTTNQTYLRAILAHPAFRDAGALSTRFLEEHLPGWQPPTSAEDIAVALVVATLAQWQTAVAGRGYWRNNPGEPARYRYRVGDEEIEVRLRPAGRAAAPLLVTLSSDGLERVVSLERFDAPDLVLTIDGYRRRVVLAARGDEWWVQGEAGPLRLLAQPLLPQPHRAADAGGSLRAPMPGTVLAVLVEVGQAVAEGQPLVKLEAMKMEYTIRAAAAGVVEAIHHAPGDSVAADALLIHVRALAV
ncbi:biotin/lipoyl-containing protein, partial [Promineifilum sp.]|uniref:biotin/lipoyl-containing protein n=1 Tax=Promineifilum sp. TaxID=2664178 RepID=UPI0035B022B8